MRLKQPTTADRPGVGHRTEPSVPRSIDMSGRRGKGGCSDGRAAIPRQPRTSWSCRGLLHPPQQRCDGAWRTIRSSRADCLEVDIEDDEDEDEDEVHAVKVKSLIAERQIGADFAAASGGAPEAARRQKQELGKDQQFWSFQPGGNSAITRPSSHFSPSDSFLANHPRRDPADPSPTKFRRASSSHYVVVPASTPEMSTTRPPRGTAQAPAGERGLETSTDSARHCLQLCQMGPPTPNSPGLKMDQSFPSSMGGAYHLVMPIPAEPNLGPLTICRTLSLTVLHPRRYICPQAHGRTRAVTTPALGTSPFVPNLA